MLVHPLKCRADLQWKVGRMVNPNRKRSGAGSFGGVGRCAIPMPGIPEASRV